MAVSGAACLTASIFLRLAVDQSQGGAGVDLGSGAAWSALRTVNWRFIWPHLCTLSGLLFAQPFELRACGRWGGQICRQ